MMLMATGGSTNAVIHLCAIAYELGISSKVVIDLFDKYSDLIPIICNICPASNYDMQDFYHGGGVPAVMKKLKAMLCNESMTVTGKTLGENLDEYRFYTLGMKI